MFWLAIAYLDVCSCECPSVVILVFDFRAKSEMVEKFSKDLMSSVNWQRVHERARTPTHTHVRARFLTQTT